MLPSPQLGCLSRRPIAGLCRSTMIAVTAIGLRTDSRTQSQYAHSRSTASPLYRI